MTSNKEEDVSKASSLPSGVGVNLRPVGSTGLNRFQGIIVEEFLKELQGKNAIRVYSEMVGNDPIVGSMLFAIEMFLRRVKWFVDPAKDDLDSEQNAQFLRECMDDMSHTWPDFISEVLSMLQHGWAYFELIYKVRNDKADINGVADSKYPDGKFGWRKFEIRSQDTLDMWEYSDDNGLIGMWQIAPPDYERTLIPIKKSLLFRTSTRKNNPEGRSVLRNAYRPWYFKKRIEEIEGVGVERDLAGLPFAEIPAEMMQADASESDKAMLASIIQLVKNVRRDEQEGVVWPQSWDDKGTPLYNFKLMNSGGSRQFDTSAIITRYEQRIAMTVLSDFILLGNDSTGSFALSVTKSGMFQAALGAWLDVIQNVLNNYAVPRLFRINGIKGPYPQFRHDDVGSPSLADMATFVAALAGAGAQLFPDVELENHFRRMAQLPLREAKDSDKQKEDLLRQKTVTSNIEAASAAIVQSKNPPKPGASSVASSGKPPTLGKKPSSVPGAPTKTTGKVKSKLPPQSRRNTASVRAAQNVTKKGDK